MDFAEAHNWVLWLGFGIAVIMGAVANKTNFCTMGAVSDLVNIGDNGRMRSWLFAIGIAIAGVAILEALSVFTLDATPSDPDLRGTRPGYRTSNFMWPRYVLGGLLFGIGMTLGSGCGNKTLVRIGGGNVKSIFVVIMIGLLAYAMNKTNFYAYVFAGWMDPLAVDLKKFGIGSQDIGGVVSGLVGGSDAGTEFYRTMNTWLGGALAVALILIAFLSKNFRGSFDNILGGLFIGLAVVAAWYVTAGPLGKIWVTELAMADITPEAVNPQSLTFVDPAGQAAHYLINGRTFNLVTFGLIVGLGVIAGSFLWSLLSRSFRFEWFVNFSDFSKHIIGGALMGIGGVMSFGCTIGQAVTGASTLALGSFLTFGAIVLGSALTMKVQLYKMVYEDAGFISVLLTSLVDMRLLPRGMRRLEAI